MLDDACLGQLARRHSCHELFELTELCKGFLVSRRCDARSELEPAPQHAACTQIVYTNIPRIWWLTHCATLNARPVSMSVPPWDKACRAATCLPSGCSEGGGRGVLVAAQSCAHTRGVVSLPFARGAPSAPWSGHRSRRAACSPIESVAASSIKRETMSTEENRPEQPRRALVPQEWSTGCHVRN